jgi:hypothetical protein
MAKLNVSALKKIDSANFKDKKDIIVRGYSLTIDRIFRPTAINALIAEWMDKMTYVRDNAEIQMSDVNWIGYYQLLLVKHFTSLDVPDDFGQQLQVLGILIDNDLFVDVMNAFDQSQVDRVGQAMQKANENFKELLPQMIQQLSEMAPSNGDEIDGHQESE